MAERIVVSLTSADQEYQALQGEDAREAGRRLGVEVEVLFAEDNAVMQIQQLFRFVHAPEGERPAALLVHTRVPDGLERVARNAAAAGVGWILLNRTAPYVDALRREHPALAVAAVTTDHVEIGRIHARQLRAAVPGRRPRALRAGPRRHAGGRLRLAGSRGGRCAGGPTSSRSSTASGRPRARRRRSRPGCGSGPRTSSSPRRSSARTTTWRAGPGRPSRRLRPDWARLPFLGCDGLPNGGRRDVDEGRLAATVRFPPAPAPRSSSWRAGSGPAACRRPRPSSPRRLPRARTPRARGYDARSP